MAIHRPGEVRDGFTLEYLKSIIHYNPDTGILTWLPRKQEMFRTFAAFRMWNVRYAGTAIGAPSKEGYLRFRIGSFLYITHRVAYFYMVGQWPDQIDHINHVRADNRWANLRSVNHADNQRNHTRRRSVSGRTGVVKSRGKWLAKIGHGPSYEYLGTFETVEAAYAARRGAEIAHGYHPNHGLPALSQGE